MEPWAIKVEIITTIIINNLSMQVSPQRGHCSTCTAFFPGQTTAQVSCSLSQWHNSDRKLSLLAQSLHASVSTKRSLLHLHSVLPWPDYSTGFMHYPSDAIQTGSFLHSINRSMQQSLQAAQTWVPTSWKPTVLITILATHQQWQGLWPKPV